MIHEENFRSRVQVVRQSARVHLLEIRRARLAKRGPKMVDRPDLVLASNTAIEPSADVGCAPIDELVSPSPTALQPEASKIAADCDALDGIALRNVALSDDRGLVTAIDDISRTHSKDQISPGSPAALKKAAKSKVRKTAATIRRPEEDGDRAVREAAFADLAGRPQAEPQASPVASQAAIVEGAEPDTTTMPDVEPNPGNLAPETDPIYRSALVDDTASTASDLRVTTTDGLPVAPIAGRAEPSLLTAANMPSDLVHLPGAGPGLVWMLQRCGINSLQDLAHTESADLVSKLGLVGQILNVEVWLDYARNRPVSQ